MIVPSGAIHQRLAGYGVSVPMHVLPTGIPQATPAPDGRRVFRQRHGIDEARPVALFVGRVAHEKNIDFLLDVIAVARAALPQILLVVAGEGPALPHLRRSVADRGLSQSVQFIGYLDRVSDLPACYAAADAFVFASRTETQGLVLLEAMAAGLPVVALAEMGTIDILGARRGALVPDDHPDAFAQALVGLLNDPALGAQLSAAGRDYAGEWSDDRLAGKMADLYRQVVAGRRRAPAHDLKLNPR